MDKGLRNHPRTLLLQSDESWVSAVPSASTQEVRQHKEQSIWDVFLGIGDASCKVSKRPVRATNQVACPAPTVPRTVPRVNGEGATSCQQALKKISKDLLHSQVGALKLVSSKS